MSDSPSSDIHADLQEKYAKVLEENVTLKQKLSFAEGKIEDFMKLHGEELDSGAAGFSKRVMFPVRKTSDSVLKVSLKRTDVHGFFLCNVKNISNDLYSLLSPISLPRGCQTVTAQWRPHRAGLHCLKPSESVDLVVQLTLELYSSLGHSPMSLDIKYVTGKTEEEAKHRFTTESSKTRQKLCVPLDTSLED